MDDTTFIEQLQGTRFVKTALYRHFDAAGALLYVGISNDALRRLCQHKNRSHWYAQIKRVDVEQFDDRASALAAEAKAIIDELPAWNVRGRDVQASKPRTLSKKLSPLKTPLKLVSVAPAPKTAAAPEPWTPRDPARPLVGMFFHTIKNGEVELQGHVLAVDGETAVAQLFSWMHGGPTNVQAFQKSFLYSSECRLYSTADDWRDWADNSMDRRLRG